MNKRENLLGDLDLKALVGIEIGPLTSPIVCRDQGEIIYVDHADTETLRRKYAEHEGIDVSRIVDVDAVWGSNTLQEAIGRDRQVDYVLASHVVEHVPDVLGWLDEIQSVLRPAGTLRLAIPDRRFTFDYLRQETRISDILNAKLIRARAPLPAQILDHVLEVVRLDANAAWRGEIGPATELPRLHRIQDAISLAEDALRNGAYHDVHCWVFTPTSFAGLLGRAAELGLHGFACIDFHDTEPNEVEFQVTLQPCADKLTVAQSWEAMKCATRVGTVQSVQSSSTRSDSNVKDLRLHSTESEGGFSAMLARATAAERRLAAIEASTSWRVTGPMRAVVQALRPGPRPGQAGHVARPPDREQVADQTRSPGPGRDATQSILPSSGGPSTSSGTTMPAMRFHRSPPPRRAGANMSGLDQTSELFGEQYFMNPTSGSAYHVNNYLETALLSRTYFEMAEIIATCFRPRKVLEVGCAAGPTVYHLNNFFSTDAYGVDVSEWAVEHRLHPNVSHASADQLPFPDDTFDVVFSCHTLEHLTAETIDKAVAEMTRVAMPGALQFHLLPILGSGPYTDVFGSMVGLRTDPTHKLLFDRAQWLTIWAKHDWKDSEVRVAHVYDNHSFEFSDCQILLTKKPLDLDICKRIAQANLKVARTLQNTLVRRPAPGLEAFLNDIRDNWK